MAILEVGLGGRLDATNVVRRPVITAVTRLDYDHVQVLGDTLTLIAGEKAGIFKRGVPCVTTPQEEEAMAALKERAAATEIPLLLAPSVDDFAEAGAEVVVGLEGEHHEINAACAVALCNGWLLRHAETAALPPLPPRPLPADPAATPAPHPVPSGGSEASELFVIRPEFRAGLEACASNWYGRSQVLDYAVGGARVTMLLDGAHTPDSMRAMGQWYDDQQAAEGGGAATVLLFFCGAEREPDECDPTPLTLSSSQPSWQRSPFLFHGETSHGCLGRAQSAVDPSDGPGRGGAALRPRALHGQRLPPLAPAQRRSRSRGPGPELAGDPRLRLERRRPSQQPSLPASFRGSVSKRRKDLEEILGAGRARMRVGRGRSR